MNYSFEGRITEKEYKTAAFSIFFTKRHIVSNLLWWLGIIVFIRLWYKENDPLYIGIISGIIIFIKLVSGCLYVPFKLGREFKKNEKLRASYRWILSDESCEIVSDFMNIRYKWNEFSRMRTKKRLILLQMKNAPSMYRIIPVRLLGTQADVIIADIEAKLKKSAD